MCNWFHPLSVPDRRRLLAAPLLSLPSNFTKHFVATTTTTTTTITTTRPARRLNGLINRMKKDKNVGGLLDLFTNVGGVLDLFTRKIQAKEILLDDIHFGNIFSALAHGVVSREGTERLKRDERFDALLASTISRLKGNSFEIRPLANICHALGKLDIKNEELFMLVASQSERLAKDGSHFDLSNIVWAFATCQIKSAALFDAVAGQGDRVARDGAVTSLSNIVWSFATNKHESTALFDAVANQHDRIARDCSPRELANIVWAFASNGHTSTALFSAVASQRERIASCGNSRVYSNTLWSFAIAGFLSGDKGTEEMLSTLWELANSEEIVSNETQLQLVSFYLLAKAEAPELNLTPPRRRPCTPMTLQNTISADQKKLSGILLKVGFQHEMEVSPFLANAELFTDLFTEDMEAETDRFFAIDFANVEELIAIEFNGPSHYLHDNREDGRTVAKRRLLEKLGWEVTSIPWFEYKRVMRMNREKKHLRSPQSIVTQLLK